MKKLLFITLSLLMFSCSNEEIKTDDLNGKVKSYLITKYEVTKKFEEEIKGDTIKERFSVYEKHYNKNGSDILIKLEGAGTYMYFYTDQNFPKQITSWSLYDEKGNFSITWEYKLNSQGKIIQQKGFSSNDEVEFYKEWNWNNDSQLVEQLNYNSEGELTTYQKNSYNAKGYKYESLEYNGEGDLISKTTNIFDDLGNIISTTEYENEKIKQKKEYTYNPASAMVEKEIFFKTTSKIIKTEESKKIFKFAFSKNQIYQTYNEWMETMGTNNHLKKKAEISKMIYEMLIELQKNPDGRYKTGIKAKERYNPNTKQFEPTRSITGSLEFEDEYGTYWFADLPEELRIDKLTSFNEWQNKWFPPPNRVLELYKESSFEYDENGNVVTEQKNDETTTYRYDYDENNNWVVKYEYSKGKIKYITERNIEYYQ